MPDFMRGEYCVMIGEHSFLPGRLHQGEELWVDWLDFCNIYMFEMRTRGHFRVIHEAVMKTLGDL